jgi:hypothetical protein
MIALRKLLVTAKRSSLTLLLPLSFQLSHHGFLKGFPSAEGRDGRGRNRHALARLGVATCSFLALPFLEASEAYQSDFIALRDGCNDSVDSGTQDSIRLFDLGYRCNRFAPTVRLL